MYRIVLLLCMSVGLGMSGLSLRAQYWTGAVNSDWNNPANWSSMPTNGSTVIIDPANYAGALFSPVVLSNSVFIPSVLVLKNGALLAVNDTLTVQDSLLLFEGNAGARTRLYHNSGRLTVNGTFGFRDESGSFESAYEKYGGELYVAGSLNWYGTGTGKGRFRISDGQSSARISGPIENLSQNGMHMYISVHYGSVLHNEGPLVHLLPGDSLFVGDDGSWSDDAPHVTWQNDGVLFTEEFFGAFFPGDSTVLTGTGLYQFYALLISNGHRLFHVSPQEMYVSGHITLSSGSRFEHFTNTLVLNGQGIQVIHNMSNGVPNAPLRFYGLRVNNPYRNTGTGHAVSINSNSRIVHKLELVRGIVQIPFVCDMHFEDDAVVTGASDSTFIYGWVKKEGNDAFEFPVGIGPDKFAPLFMDAPADVSTRVRTRYRAQTHPKALTGNKESPLQDIGLTGYWQVERNGSSTPIRPGVRWTNAAAQGLTGCPPLELARWDSAGNQWKYIAATPAGQCTGNGTGSLQADAAGAWSGDLAIGFTQDSYQQMLELCTQDSYAIGNHVYTENGVYIDTLTAADGGDSIVVTVLTIRQPQVSVSVINHGDYFEAQHENAMLWGWINCETGQPVITSNPFAFYPPQTGTYAFWATSLYCTDADTSECIYIEVPVNPNSQDEFVIQHIGLYPNPADDRFTLKLPVSEETPVRIDVTDMSGKQCLVHRRILAPGTVELVLDCQELPSGIYTVTVHAGNKKMLPLKLVLK